MTIQLTEFGAAETVPGSKLLLETSGRKHLIDIGKNYQEEGRQAASETRFPFDPKTIDDLILTHAHADHMGDLLEFHRQGFTGPIFSTFQTAAITALQMQQDVASVAIYNRIIKGKRFRDGPRRGQLIPFKKARYGTADIAAIKAQFTPDAKWGQGLPYESVTPVNKDLHITFYEAGHIPGSAQILYDINDAGHRVRLLTAFDLGRTDYEVIGRGVADTPIVKSPHRDFPGTIDYIVLESTYGNKTHKDLSESIKSLQDTINETADRKGKLILPAFSIMRTHMLWNFLYRLHEKGALPEGFMIYASSPMADQVSKIILDHIEDLDDTARREFANRHYNPFYFDRLVHHTKFAQTQAILDDPSKAPYAIVASSGMCNMGRVVEVLRQTIGDPRNIVMLSGYQSPGTRGYLLSQGVKRIPFETETVECKADIKKLSGLSGHADAKEQVEHLRHIDPQRKLKGIFLKHGEKDACYAFRDTIISELGYAPEKVIVMKKGQRYEL